MRHVQAERLDHAGGLFLELAGHRLKRVGRKELARIAQGFHLRIAGGDLLFVHLALVLAGDLGDHLLARLRLKARDDVVGDLVHHMHGAGAHVQHDVVTAELILMNHLFLSLNMA